MCVCVCACAHTLVLFLVHCESHPHSFLYGLVGPEDPSTASTEQGDRRGSKEAETHSKGMVKQESDDRPMETGEGAEGKVLSKAELKRQRREKQVGCM